MNFNLWKHHNMSPDVLDNMMPFERDIYTILLREWLEEEKQRRERENMKNG
jgi:hypothetical protein